MSKSYSVNEWGAMRKVSRSRYYELKSRGEAPRSYKNGNRDRITDEADAEWVAAQERATREPAAKERAERESARARARRESPATPAAVAA